MTDSIKTVYDGMSKLITAIESGKANNEKVLIALCKSVKALCNEASGNNYPGASQHDFSKSSGIEDLLRGFGK